MRATFLVSTAAVIVVAATSQAAVRFSAPVSIDHDATAMSVALADIDGDGAIDLVAAMPEGIRIFYGDMHGGVRDSELIPMASRAQSIALVDLNRDGVADIVASTRDGVYNVLSSGRHYEAPQLAGPPDSLVTKLVDINGDGFADKVMMDRRSKALFVQLADGRGGFGQEQTIELPDVATSFAVADFDRDGHIDLAASIVSSNRISILAGDGNGGFTAANSIDAGGVPLAIASGDLKRNGSIDLVVAYAKGIAFLPNTTEPVWRAPSPGRRIQSDSLQAAPQSTGATLSFTFQSFDPNFAAYQWNDPNNWIELDANGVSTGVHRVPGPGDTASIAGGPASAPVAVIGGASVQAISSFANGGLSIGSPHPPFVAGELDINGSQFANLDTIEITQGSTLMSAGQLVINNLSVLFGGSIIATSQGVGFHGLQVSQSVDWDGNGSITVLGGGDAVFFSDSTVFGQMQLCQGTTLNLYPGTTMSLGGVIRPCPGGSGTLNAIAATINALADDFPGIFSNLSGDQSTIKVTGNGPLNIFGVGGFNPTQGMTRSTAHLSAGTTLNLGNFFSGGFTTDGLGTTVASGILRGVTTVNNPMTVSGTLGSAPGENDFTVANGPLNLRGSVIGHALTINGSGSQLTRVCVANGGIVLVQSDMTTVGTPVIDASCGTTPGVFRVVFNKGSLTIPDSLVVNPNVEFENDGTVNLQNGTLTIWASPVGYVGFGQYNLAAGTAVQAFSSLAFGGNVSGDGLLQVGGSLHGQGATIANLQAGNVDGAFTVTHNMLWTNGTISNGNATIAAGATLNSAPHAVNRFSNTSVQINGTANIESACVTDGASLNVNFGGAMNVSPPFGTVALSTCGSTGSLRINTNGKLTVNVTGRSVMVLPSTIFGTIEVAGNGTLSYLAPSSWFPSLQAQLIVDGGTTMSFQDNEQFPSGNFQATGGGLVSFDAGTFSGSPLFFSNVSFNNAHMVGSGGNVLLACCGGSSANQLTVDAGNTLTINSTLSVPATGRILNNGTIQNRGTLSVFADGSAITGSGVVHNDASLAGGSAAGTTIDCTVTNGNFGRIVANNGSLNPRFLTNAAGGVLTGGSYEADSNSTLVLGSVNSNAANLTANGGRLAFNNLSSNMPSGNIALINGGTISGAGGFTNNGAFNISTNSVFSPFSYTQAAGKTSLTDSSAQLNAPTVLQGGVLEGYGTISPSLQNLGGDLQPDLGNPTNHTPGTLTVQGNYSEGPGSNLHVFINSQTQYSQLHVTGAATLAGTIQLDPAVSDDGFGDQFFFFPNPGDAFKVLTFGTRAGSFATIVGQDLTFIQDFLYTPHYNANDLTFVVETVDPKVMIASLEGTIATFQLDKGTAQSLTSKLDAALSALKRGDAGAACGQLGSAVNFTNAESGKKITTDQAATILDTLAKIRAKVGCR